jgi:formamidopyrimidine-DNA glycosylase
LTTRPDSTLLIVEMPELPEVETVVRSIASLKGRRIVSAELRGIRVLRGCNPEEMAERLSNRRIAGLKRFGKFILITLDPEGYLLVHLGMTGKLLTGGPPGKHTHAILNLDRGVLLYDDPRQFGCFQFSETMPERLRKLGPEPLEVEFEEFAKSLRARKSCIKSVLLNQRFLRGIGNIYADEALFRAGIHPTTRACAVSRERARKLHDAITAVLTEAISAGGSSISDYVDAQGRRGFFQVSHRVYQRTGEPCICCGTPIRRLIVAQRSSHFCPKCQKRR